MKNIDFKKILWQSSSTMQASSLLIYADTADPQKMIALSNENLVDGFTTNPSLMKAAGVNHYGEYAKWVGKHLHKPVSLEVIGDTVESMIEQGRMLASFGQHIVVKIPIINTKKELMVDVLHALCAEGIAVNVTAVLTETMFETALSIVNQYTSPAIISLFVGRIADTGRDPVPFVKYCVHRKKLTCSKASILWASTREVYNIKQAAYLGCDIITVPMGLLYKTQDFDKDLMELTHEAVFMFKKDAEGMFI